MNSNDKLLITSTQYAGYGGTATNAYALIKQLKEKRKDIMFVAYFTIMTQQLIIIHITLRVFL